MFARTQRLTLRPGWPEDAPALAAAIGHWEVAKRLAKLPWPYTVEHAESWLNAPAEPGHVALLIYAHEHDVPALVGGVGLHPDGAEMEIGYWLTPTAWGHGYATEAARAMVAIAHHALGRKRLVSGHFVDNPASGKVLRKLGFEQTGLERRDCLARGEKLDCATFELAL